MKAVVTGCNGFVGRALVKKLISENYVVFGIDIPQSFSSQTRTDNFIPCPMDIKDIASLSENKDVLGSDVFFHFAWRGSAGPLRMDEKVQTENALLAAECLKFAAKIKIKRFVFAGTIMEFETHEAIYAQETKPALPYIYGAGKVLAHNICKPLANSLGIDLVWAYITNAYGVGELSPRLINSTMKKIYLKEPLEFTSGTQSYDFIYVDDVAEAFYLLGEKGKANKGYVIGSGEATQLKKFLKCLIDVLDPNAKYIFGNVPFTGVDLPLETFSTKEIKKDCGFAPKVTFEEGVKKTYEWISKEFAKEQK